MTAGVAAAAALGHRKYCHGCCVVGQGWAGATQRPPPPSSPVQRTRGAQSAPFRLELCQPAKCFSSLKENQSIVKVCSWPLCIVLLPTFGSSGLKNTALDHKVQKGECRVEGKPTNTPINEDKGDSKVVEKDDSLAPGRLLQIGPAEWKRRKTKMLCHKKVLVTLFIFRVCGVLHPFTNVVVQEHQHVQSFFP